LKRFQRLSWKLTIFYLITNVTILCLLELLVIFIAFTTIGIKTPYPFWEKVSGMLLFFGGSVVVFLLGTGAVGLAFGVLAARGLVQRLQATANVVDGWSHGDFSHFVPDTAEDELGQLVHNLNQMAHQLQHLLSTRQDMATQAERQRLARDLHDSVKQQIFAASLHISTARAFWGHDEKSAQTSLLKAEGLIQQAQQELTALIHALRPVVLEGRSLQEALQTYVHAFQKQTGIAVEFQIQGNAQIAPAIEEACFRVAQEAMANIARHSQALSALVHLNIARTVTLIVSDNGCGFDPQSRNDPGIGLSSMHERVQALGGHLAIQSEKGQGTTITAWFEQALTDAKAKRNYAGDTHD
jgi:NarL family two-component system sensor histidine kinase LiaS